MKFTKTSVLGLVSVFLLSALSLTCTIGLGDSVDTKAPQVAIAYPPVQSIIRNTFTMNGTASDDVKLLGVTARVVNTVTGAVYEGLRAEIDPVKKTWSLPVNVKDANGVYAFPDGTYQITISATDGANRTTVASTTYEIDNTPPVLVLNRPSTFGPLAGKVPEVYGSELKVTGSVNDDHAIERLEFQAFTAAGTPVATPLTYNNISGVGMELTLAKFFVTPTNQEQTDLRNRYLSLWNETLGGTQSFYATINVSDAAREFNPPADVASASNERGNVSESYYIYDDIYSSVFAASGFNLQMKDLTAIFNNTFADAAKAEQVRAYMETRKKPAATWSTAAAIFSLNPDISPTYTIIGYEPITATKPINTFRVSNESTINVRVSANRDAIPLAPDSIRVTVTPVNATTLVPTGAPSVVLLRSASELTGDAVALADRDARLSKTGGDYVVSVVIKGETAGPAITTNTSYLLDVEGVDLDGNIIQERGNYGFQVVSSGNPPAIIVSSPGELSYTNASSVSWNGTVATDTGFSSLTASVTYYNKNTGVVLAARSAEAQTVSTTPVSANVESWSFTLDTQTGVPLTGTYRADVTLVATDTNNSATTIIHRIYVDHQVPTAEISSPPSIGGNVYEAVNGLVSVTIRCSDNESVQSASYTLNGGAPVAFAVPANTTITNIDTNNYDDASGTGSLDFVVTVTDTAGNVGTYNGSIPIDQASDRPVIAFNNLTPGASYLANNLGVTRAVSGTIVDDDGVDRAKIVIAIAPDANQDGTPDSAFTPVVVSGQPAANGKSVSWSHNLASLAQGYYLLQVKSGDILYGGTIASESNTGVFSWSRTNVEKFVIDYSAPSVTIDQAPNEFKSGSFILSGTAQDDLGLQGNQIQIGAANVAVDPATHQWTYTVPGGAEGNNSLTITATDNAGQVVNQVFTYRVDTTIPTVTLSTDLSATQYSPIIAIGGSAADTSGTNPSGVERVEYRINGGGWISLNGTSSWSGNITVPAGVTHTLNIRSVDFAGNPSAVLTRTITMDSTAPLVTFNIVPSVTQGANNYFNGLVNFNASIQDGSVVQSVYWRVATVAAPVYDATSDATMTGGGWTVYGGVNKNDWTVTNYNTATLTDNTTHYVVVVAVDRFGNSGSYNYPLPVNQSTDKPSIAFINMTPAAAHLLNNLGLSGTLNGTITDDDAVSSTRVYIGIAPDANQDGVPDSAFTFNAVSGSPAADGKSVSWSHSVSSLAEGYYVLRVKTADINYSGAIATEANMSNYSWSQSAIEKFVVDIAPPALTVDQAQNNWRSGSFALSGSASDTLGLEGNQITVNGATVAVAAGTWTTTVDTTAAGYVDGTNTISIIATDVTGRSANQTFTFKRDSQDPTIAITTTNTGWKNQPVLAVAGTASDPGGASASGLSRIEYSSDGTNWTSLSGTTAWTGSIPVNAGANSLSFRAVDASGRNSAELSRTFNVDLDNPEVTVTAPSALLKVRSGQDIAVQCTVTDIGSGISQVRITRIGGTTLVTPISATRTTGDGFSGTWQATIPAATLAGLSLTDGNQYQVSVEAIDDSTRTGSSSFSIQPDFMLPDVAFSAPVSLTPPDLPIVNKTIKVSGTASDTQGLQSVVLSIQRADTTWVVLDTFTDSAAFNWSIPAFNTLTYDSATFDTGAAALVQLTLRAVATDVAGNERTATHTFTVDQNSDRPTVKVSNLSVTSIVTLKNSSTVYGTVTDDDGVSLFECSDDGTTWTTVPHAGGSWSYASATITVDGERRLYFRVTDTEGTIFTTDLVNEPYVASNSDTAETFVTYRVDTQPPTISTVVNANGTELSNNRPFGGGAGNSIVISLDATDLNGIAFVTVSIEDIAGVQSTTRSGDTFTTAALSLSALDGYKQVVITARDNSGLESTVTRTILVDNLAPEVRYSSPRMGIDTVNGAVNIVGETVEGGSGMQSVQYALGYDYASRPWTSTGGSLVSWKIEYTNADPIEKAAGVNLASLASASDLFTLAAHGYANGTIVWLGADVLPGNAAYGTPYYVIDSAADTFRLSATSGGASINFSSDGTNVYVSSRAKSLENNIWSLPVLIHATDKAGNSFTSPVEEYLVKVDPSGDKPKVSVTYPETNPSTLGGTIRITGIAEDDDAVQAVYMQIDVNNDGLFTAADVASNSVNWYEGGEGREVTGSASWRQTINADSEFNPTGADTIKTIRFRVRAKDIYGVFGGWSEPYVINVDKNVPQFSAFSLTQDATNRSYVTDMWIRGSWTLTGTVVDESNIDLSSVTVSGTISGGGTSVPYTGAWTTTIHTEGGKTGYRISIPLDTASMSGSVISLQVRASDNNSPQMSASQSFSIQFDNTAPDQLTYGGDVPVVNSNNLYEAKGTVRELGSGYARTLVYLTRDGINAANNRLYDPRLPVANSKLLSALTERDGIPMQTLTVTSRTATSLTATELENNDFVRIGTMVYLDGVYYRITSYDPLAGTIGWTEDVPAITVAAVPYALVIDHVTSEYPVWDATNTTYTIDNDDGDDLIESVKSNSGLVNWACSFDARYIPDGNITVHYVVFDQAGNYTAATKVSQVRNNPPLLAKVTLGTDLSGNNAIEAAEWVEPFSAKDGSGNNQAIATVDSGTFKAKALTHVDIDVVGGNGDLKYVLTVGEDVIHPLATSTLRVGTTGTINKIPITVAELQAATIGEGLKDFKFTIWDSTDEYVVGTSTYSATLTVPMTVDAVDEVSPEVKISPLYWTDEDDNSLFEFSRDNGHIELSADLDTGTFDSSTALLDIDDKISGKITIRGTAYDDQRLTDLWMYFGNGTNNTNKFAFTGAAAVRTAFDFTPANAYATTTLATEYSRMAHYTPGSGWSVATTAVDNQGWKFTVVSNSLDQSGHTVEWMLEIDTGMLPEGPALNRVIRIIAEDKRASGATPQPNASLLAASANNVPELQVDVVPYITEVKTNLSDFYASNASVHSRSALGKYPVGENEVIDIKGYNLSTSATVRLNGVILDDPTLVDGNLQTNIGTAATSGVLVVTIGTTESLNDRNNNNAEYNKMPNKVNNNLLTDDVSLDVWGVKHVASPRDGGIIHPEMGIGPKGEIGFAFVNGNFYFNMAGPANAGETFTSGGGTSTWASQRAYEKEYAQYWESAFAFDGAGNTYGMSTNIDVYLNGGNNYSAYTSFYFGRRAGQINPPNGGTQGWNSTPGNYYGGLFRRRLQSTTSTVSAANISDTNPNRAQSPSLATATHGTRTNVYVAYYDAVRKEIRYRYGSVGRSWEKRISADALDGANTRITTTTNHNFAVGDLVSFTKQSNAYLPAQAQIDTYTVQSVIDDTRFTVNGNITAWVNDNTYVSAIGGQLMDATGGFSSTQGVEAGVGPDDQSVRASMYTVVAGPGSSGKYVSVGVVPGATASADVAVIVWFDAGSKTLKYGYCESPQQDDAVFTVSTIDTAGAWYPRIAVDGSGGIHVAYYGTSGADLKYAYASRYDLSFTTITVDSFQLVGTQITLDVATDTAGNVVPYIGYYSPSAQTAKLAYPVSFNTGKPTKAGVANDLYTGFWEVTNVPSDAYTPKDDTICVGVHKEWTGANKGRIAPIASDIGTLSSADDTDNNFSSRIGGNGTDNPVVGFVVQDDDSLKMAQKK